jgi:hypothetical protein
MQLLYLDLVIAICAFMIPLLFLSFYRRRHAGKNKRAPFTDRFLRSPGQSLFDQIQELNEDLIYYFFSVSIIPVLFTSTIIIFHMRKIISPMHTITAGTFFFLLEVYYFGKSCRGLIKRRRMRLGYDGEVVVGQELNLLMLDGYHVFHDLVTDRIKKLNIDHIIVGSSGVYAVETKTRSKSRNGSGKLNYDGKSIQFPDGTDSSSIDLAIRHAAWLRKWLTSTVGVNVDVEPVVALPGWYINRTAKNGIAVLDPRMIGAYIKNKNEKPLSNRLIREIVHQIDRKCRDVDQVTA